MMYGSGVVEFKDTYSLEILNNFLMKSFLIGQIITNFKKRSFTVGWSIFSSCLVIVSFEVTYFFP